jgi:lipid-A-disaccharide synthase
LKLLVCAMEHSSNLHLSALKKELGDDVELIGIFDKQLGNPLVDLSSLAIMGFVDAIKKLRFFFKLSDEMLELSRDADKVLLMDSSGFNLPLAKKIRKKYPDKEIIYYILPQAWAWKQKRIPVLEKTITTLASILPFEKGYYSKNAPISYVGHPLLDEITEYKNELTSNKKIAFMPGSRRGEIKKLMPIFHELRKKLDSDAYIIIPKQFSKEDIKEVYGNLSEFKIVHETHQTLLECDFAFICSGTATLEAALIGVPFVLSYIAKPLDYFLASRLVKLKYIGLSNIMFDKFKGEVLHPEFVQNDVTVENLYNAYVEYDKEKFLNNSKELRKYLSHGSSKTVASIIEDRK